MSRLFILIILLITLLTNSFAQQLVTIDEAIAFALKNNFGIMVANNEAEIARINNTAGNAGMLPSISIAGSNNYSLNDVEKKKSDGTEIATSNVGTSVFNGTALLNWTLFDGGKMFVTKSKLNEIETMGALQYKGKVIQTVYDVILAYYNVVRQNQQLASINKVIEFNQERVKIFQTSFSSGLAPKTDLLQAKIDLNVYTENAISQQYVINSAKRNLNQLLSRNIDSIAFDVIDSIPLSYTPNRDEIMQKAQTKNTSVLMFKKQVDINSLVVKEIKSTRLPIINFNAGYDFLQMNYTKSDLLSNREYGPQIGASIRIPIFDGGEINRQVSVAKLNLTSAGYVLESVKLEVNIQVQDALTDFENQQVLLAIELENNLLAKENLEISMQRLRYGQTTSLEVRQAQESYTNSLTRLINFQYNLKVAETKLKRLISEL